MNLPIGFRLGAAGLVAFVVTSGGIAASAAPAADGSSAAALAALESAYPQATYKPDGVISQTGTYIVPFADRFMVTSEVISLVDPSTGAEYPVIDPSALNMAAVDDLLAGRRAASSASPNAPTQEQVAAALDNSAANLGLGNTLNPSSEANLANPGVTSASIDSATKDSRCGSTYYWHIHYESGWGYGPENVSQDTTHHVRYCYQAWMDTQTPGCQVYAYSPNCTWSKGEIGRGSYNDNPWINFYVTGQFYYGTMYCRNYLDARLHASGWCSK